MFSLSPLRKLSMLSLVFSEVSPLTTTARPPSSKTELREESVPSDIVFVVLVVGLNHENMREGSGEFGLSIN